MASKTLLEYGFSQPQLKKIFEFLKYVHLHTTESIKDRIEGIRYFIDSRNNFYASYCLISGLLNENVEEHTTELKYVLINQEGEEINLFELYDNSADIIKRYSNYFEIEIV